MLPSSPRFVGTGAEIDCRQAARRAERQRHQRLISLPLPPGPPFDIEKRRGIGGVLDAGEAGARRESPPSGAGESILRSHRTSLASDPRLDSSRRARIRNRHARTLGPKHQHRLESPGNRPRRRPHPRLGIHLTPETTGSKQTSDTIQNPADKKCLGKAVRKGILNAMGVSP